MAYFRVLSLLVLLLSILSILLLIAGSAEPDKKLFSIASTLPTVGTTGVSVRTSVTAAFSGLVDSATINSSTFQLRNSSNEVVASSITYDSSTRTATLSPTSPLKTLSTYTAIVQGGTAGVRDVAGNTLSAGCVWSFTTMPVPPSSGPGGPILVISSVVNPFTRYYSEILNTEGLNEYTVADIALLSSTVLSSYDVAILGEMPLTKTQVSVLSDWVYRGGRLIAMRPDKHLASMLGLTPTKSTLSNAYLKVWTASGPGLGIIGETIQFHGTADLYTLNGATSVATLFSSTSTPTTSPAVTLVNVGTGQAAAFTYDLARSIIYTRQGNPAWSGQKRDGQIPPMRPDDLYFGAASFDPRPDWVDLTKVSIPQADEQQRLLANIIIQMAMPRKPLPRFWYFPNGFKAAVVMTGDDHGTGGTSSRFDRYFADSPAGCSVANWGCVRSTSYVYPGTPIAPTQMSAYTAQGFEVALHVNTDCSDWTRGYLELFYASELADFSASFPNAPAPRTNRTHCIAWSDYDTQPQVELNHRIRFDTNYYYWPPTWVNNQAGLFTGSGMPMRFTDRNGNLIDVYQATTQMTDESGQSYPFTINSLLDGALGSQGFYGAFTANMHTDSVDSQGSDAIVAAAQARGVPVVSALQMLNWLDGRNSSSFGSLTWSGNTLSFTINQASGARNLRAMLPIKVASQTLSSISVSGIPVSFTSETIKGVRYAMFDATSGSYQAVYDGVFWAPVLSSTEKELRHSKR